MLDRDGIINFDHGYVYKIEEFEFKPEIFALCEHAQALGYLIIVVTNQAGIARGLYTEDDVAKLHDWMIAQFAQREIKIEQVYYCPHHPEHGGLQYQHNCLCRKPMPGMILRAKREFHLDLASSVMIGDKVSDMQAALAAQVGVRILLKSDYTQTLNLIESGATEVISELNQISL